MANRSYLPARYRERWLKLFEDHVDPVLKPGVRVLDVGSGRRPAIPPDRRPPGCLYVGLDLSMEELQRAPPGSYDEMLAGDVVEFRPELCDRFDLVVSWQVLEHVKPLDAALENIRRYLLPGGTFVAQLSGRFSVFAVLNRLIPHRVSVWAMARLLARQPHSVFPAAYDRCWYDALVQSTSSWSEATIVPRYNAAAYFGFLSILQRAYVAYENWTVRGLHRNLATHYLISARR